MTKSRIFLFFLLSFIGGVFTRSFFEIGDIILLCLIITSIILLIIFYKNFAAAVAAFILFGFIFGAWRTNHVLQEVNGASLAGKTFKGKSVVLRNSDSTFGQNLVIEFIEEKVFMLMQVPDYPSYAYGDVLNVSCTAKRIENKEGSEFDYRMYMAKDNILYKCESKEFKKISDNGGNFIMRNIVKIKNNFEKNINELISVPESALAGGVLFGGSDALPEEIKNDFSRTGMTHIVAVSGYNVTIIAEYLILVGIFLGLWRKQAIWFAIFGIVMFVIMVGLPASAVRAGVMSSILLWAIKNGRLANSENAIILAGAIMLVFNPLLLRWDIGFELSFLATLGIVLMSPFWEKSFIKKHKAFGISEMIALSLSAQIFVLPIIAYNFHMASLVSLLANILILPIVPLSMLLVFLVSTVGILFGPLATVFAWLAYLLLHWEIYVIHLLSSFRWASLQMENVSVWFVIIYYIILLMVLIALKNPNFKLQISNKVQNLND